MYQLESDAASLRLMLCDCLRASSHPSGRLFPRNAEVYHKGLSQFELPWRQRMISTAVRSYLTHFAIDKGKWHVWCALRDKLPASKVLEVTQLPVGFLMELDGRQWVEKHIAYWGTWDENQTRLLSRLLRRGDTFLDIGANVGYFSLLAGSLVGHSGHVHAIEATPQTARRLRRNIGLNQASNVTVYNVAVADAPGTVRIGVAHEGNWGSNSIGYAEKDLIESWEVPAARVDDLVGDAAPSVIKMDIEGAEVLALRGMQRLLTEHSPVVVSEVSGYALARMGHTPDDLVNLMNGLGYQGYTFEKCEIQPLDMDVVRRASEINVMFVKGALPASIATMKIRRWPRSRTRDRRKEIARCCTRAELCLSGCAAGQG